MVTELGAAGREWNSYVDSRSDASLYHTLAWRDVVVEAFGHEPLYLAHRTASRVDGILPLFRLSAPLLGVKLISMPYDIGSSLLASGAEAERALLARAVELARAQRAAYLELRCRRPLATAEALGFRRSEPVLLSEVELDDPDAAVKRISRRYREYARFAERQGVSIREAESLADYRAFYEVYLRVFRAFATPPYAFRYFTVIHRHLHDRGAARLLLADLGGRIVGGLLLFVHGATVTNKFSVMLPEAERSRAMVALYTAAIRRGFDWGGRRLSLGSSGRSQSGLIAFKERLGAVATPASVYSSPIHGAVPSLERYFDDRGLERRLWRHLPLGVTRVAGGLLNRWFC